MKCGICPEDPSAPCQSHFLSPPPEDARGRGSDLGGRALAEAGLGGAGSLALSPQVGIVLHYSTLSTMLWIGVAARNIYKQVTKKAPLCPGADQPPHPKQPLLRY